MVKHLLLGISLILAAGTNSARAAFVGLSQLSCESSNDVFGDDEVYVAIAGAQADAPPGLSPQFSVLPGPAPSQAWSLDCRHGNLVQRVPLWTQLPLLGGHVLLAVTVVERDDDSQASTLAIQARLAGTMRAMLPSDKLDPLRPYLEQIDIERLKKLTSRDLEKLHDDDLIGIVFVEIWTDFQGLTHFKWVSGRDSDTIPTNGGPLFSLHGSGSRYRMLLDLIP